MVVVVVVVVVVVLVLARCYDSKCARDLRWVLFSSNKSSDLFGTDEILQTNVIVVDYGCLGKTRLSVDLFILFQLFVNSFYLFIRIHFMTDRPTD